MMGEPGNKDFQDMCEMFCALNNRMHNEIVVSIMDAIIDCSQTVHEWLNFAALHEDFKSASWLEKHEMLGQMQPQIKLLMPIVTQYKEGTKIILDQSSLKIPSFKSTGIFKNALSGSAKLNDPDFDKIESEIFTELNSRQIDRLVKFIGDASDLLDLHKTLFQREQEGDNKTIPGVWLSVEYVQLMILHKLAASCMRIISKATGFLTAKIYEAERNRWNSRKEQQIQKMVMVIKSYESDQTMFSKKGKPNDKLINIIKNSQGIESTTKRTIQNHIKEIYEKRKLLKKRLFS